MISYRKKPRRFIAKIVREYQRQDRKTITNALLENFCYGFTQMAVPTMISLGFDIGVIMTMLIYYSFLSIVINRDKYETILGQHIIFPGACSIGGYLGYLFATLIESFI